MSDRLAAAYRDRRVLLTGATGFLGGVTLSMLLARCRDAARIFVLVRRAPGLPAAERFDSRVLPAAAFDPVRADWPAIAPRVTVLQGDLGLPGLGLDAADSARLAGLDLILNCAGLVDFEAPLDLAHRTNVEGVRHLAALAVATGAHLVHVSTCFVAGRATGTREERVEAGFFPRREEAPYLDFDPEREVADVVAEIGRHGAAVEEQAALAGYRERALVRFREQSGGLPSPAVLANAARRLQRDDLRERLVAAGARRAAFWGWPNVYTYSKSIGEQLLVQALEAQGLRCSLVRPAIVESALAYPEPGYNLNATTTAPLVMLALDGFQLAPAKRDLLIDIVPVDAVARGILAVGAAALEGTAEDVYQVGTSDVNPCRMDRVIELMGLYIHERELGAVRRPPGAARPLRGVFAANREPVIVDRAGFETRTRQLEALWRELGGRARDLSARVDHPRTRELLGRAATWAERSVADIDKARSLWELFMPFAHDQDYRFVTRRIRELWARLDEPVDLGALDWRTYWLEIHIPGLRKHVLTESFGKAVKPVPTPMSLAERVESVARDDPYRPALTWLVAGKPRTLTYGELWERAGAVAGAIADLGADCDEASVAFDGVCGWVAALLGAQRAGKLADLEPDAARAGRRTPLRLRPEADGCTIAWGRRRRRVAFEGITPRAVSAGPSACANAPGLRLAGGVPLAGRDLARRLERLASWLDLAPGAAVVVSADAAPLARLVALHARCEQWLVADAAVPAACAASGATAAILGKSVPAEPGRLRAVVDAAPLAGVSRLQPLLARRITVTQVLLDGLTLQGGRPLAGAGDRDEAFAPDPEAHGDAPDPTRVPAAVLARLLDSPAVAAAVVLGEEGSRSAIVQPDLGRFRDFRRPVAALEALLRETNAAVPASLRLHGLAVTLGPLPASSAEEAAWETRSDWIRLSPRGERPDWDAQPADRIPVEDLEDEVWRLARGRLAPTDLAFVADHHAGRARTYASLLVLERVLVGMFSGAAPFNAQAFLQRYGDEEARTRTPTYRLGFCLGAVARRWREWHAAEDPAGTLLPAMLTEPVKHALGQATGALIAQGLDVDVRGAAYVPAQGRFVIVANHSSHLDTGVIKYALGAWGDRVRALAAKDYFFGTPARRFLAHHFTRLIPTERQTVSTDWIKRAREALHTGDCVLIFPEGTRTADPEVGPFKASLGTLLRACQADVLPIYVHGTHEILPKGRLVPGGRSVRVHIGPLVPYAHLEQAARDAGGTLARDRRLAEYLRRVVAALQAGDFFWLEGAAR